MKEIFQVFEARIRSPLMGYATFAFVAFNWKEIFFLFASNSEVSARLEYFQENTGPGSLVVYPLLLGALLTIIYPWVSYGFIFLCGRPTDLRNNLQARAEHRLLQQKEELERFRAAVRARAERNFIDEAKRDAELDQIDDEEAKSRAKSKIERLRSSHTSAHGREPVDPQQFLDMAEKFRDVARKVSSDSEEYKLLKARINNLERQAYEAVIGNDA